MEKELWWTKRTVFLLNDENGQGHLKEQNSLQYNTILGYHEIFAPNELVGDITSA